MSRFWQHFISDGHGGQTCPGLGIHGHAAPIVAHLVRTYELARPTGVEVWRIEAGSPAEQAGLLEDDLILAVADHPAANMEQLSNLVKQLRPGAPVAVALLRGECRLERLVVVGDQHSWGSRVPKAGD